MSIEVIKLNKRYGDFIALDDVSFVVPEGELVALLGPSGSGKSTILRVIAGLEAADSGTVVVDGEPTLHLHARQRRVGFVFQHYALFRHMSIFDNVAFGLTVRQVPAADIARRVGELLGVMGLHGLEHRLPTQLSGGQRQRVALARALAPEPRVLLLDEPFAAVDAKVRLVIRSYDLKFWRDDAEGIATVERLVPLGDRVRVEAQLPGVGALFSHFPRRSSLLKGVEPGCRIAVEVTLARAYPR